MADEGKKTVEQKRAEAEQKRKEREAAAAEKKKEKAEAAAEKKANKEAVAAQKAQRSKDQDTILKELPKGKVGYVMVKGAKDTLVGKHVNIYTNTSLWTVTREGEDVEITSDDRKKIKKDKSYKETREELEKKINEANAKAAKDVKKKTLGLVSGKSIIVNPEAIIESQVKDAQSAEFESSVGGDESTPSSATEIKTSFWQNLTDNFNTQRKHGFTNSSVGEKAYIRHRVENFFIGTMNCTAFLPLSLINMTKGAAEKAAKKAKAAEMLKTLEGKTGNFKGQLVQWFADQEALIDALPTMSDLGGDVYVVEYRENYEMTLADGSKETVNDWFYTGEATKADQKANQKIQYAKAKVCAYLNERVEYVNNYINGLLEDSVKKVSQCEIFISIIELIKKVPSLTTIIKWATAIIDFFIEIYKMIFNIFKTAMEIIELVLIRGPQLINKIIQKITAFDCDLSLNIQVNTKGDK